MYGVITFTLDDSNSETKYEVTKTFAKPQYYHTAIQKFMHPMLLKTEEDRLSRAC